EVAIRGKDEPEPEPEPETEKKDKKSSSSGDSTPPNPDALTIIYIKDGAQVPSARAAKQVQGPAAQAVFSFVRAPGCNEAFSFNFMQDGRTIDYELKDGKLILFIPNEYQRPGRKFALVALSKDGVHFYPDLDTSMATITVDLDLAGYAFDLVYAG
nr:hypothetical protein [Lachnospiraceae bacterium]